jgi:predicted NACHT family NTPase
MEERPVVWPEPLEYAQGEYIRLMSEQCGHFARTFRGSEMNRLTDETYVRQSLEEIIRTEAPSAGQAGLDDLVLERVPRPRGLEERDVPIQRQFLEALGLEWPVTSDTRRGDGRGDLHRKIVIVGRAGRGKTSLLYWAVQEMLKRLEKDPTAVVPVYVPLSELVSKGSLASYLRAGFTDKHVLEWIQNHVTKSNVIFLLDALDEVPRDARLPLLSDRGSLAELVRTLDAPQSRIVLTCRDAVYGELSDRLSELRRTRETEGFVKMELKRFTREQIVQYAQRYFRDEPTAQAFLKDIEDPRGQSAQNERSSRYTHLAEEPLYLHMLCWLWAGSDHSAVSQ